MQSSSRTSLGVVAIAMALATVPAIAQDKQPYSEANPTKESPLRFSAFAVNMQAGLTGQVMITIERWTAKDEREMLAQSSLAVKDGKLSIEIYGQEPTRLTTITETNPKQKKK